MATPSEEDRATAAGNIQKKFGEVQPCGIRVTQTDRQTDRRDVTIQYFWLRSNRGLDAALTNIWHGELGCVCRGQ